MGIRKYWFEKNPKKTGFLVPVNSESSESLTG